MKEAEIAANLAQKERESRARDLVELMQSKDGRPKDDSRTKGSGTDTELTEIKPSDSGNDAADNESSIDCLQQVEAQLHESPDDSDKRERIGKAEVETNSSTETKTRRERQLLNFEDEDKIVVDETADLEENGDKTLSSVDLEVSKCRQQEKEKEKADSARDEVDFEKNIRSEPDGLPDDIESLELHSETNSNEFEMVPSRPDSESSKSSFDVADINVEKIVVRDGAKSSTLSEEVSLVT